MQVGFSLKDVRYRVGALLVARMLQLPKDGDEGTLAVDEELGALQHHGEP